MDTIRNFITNEPLWTRASVAAIVAVAASLGFDLDAEAVAGVFTVLFGVAVGTGRAKVTPDAKLDDEDDVDIREL